jgi:regulator of RNase E activity RraB
MVQLTSDWDSYVVRVDGKVASIVVDLGALPKAPSAALPYLGCFRLHMNAPRADGLSGSTERDALIAIEDALSEELVENGTVYVGRCTSNARRDFFFYLPKPDGWSARARDCMRTFPGYRFESFVRDDREWSTYRDFLYPSAGVLRSISNRRACRQLEKQGDALRATREIDHFASFHDTAARDAFVRDAERLGFAVRAITGPGETSSRCSVQLWRGDVPSFPGIDDVTRPLLELAAKHGGEYDGWETQVLSA